MAKTKSVGSALIEQYLREAMADVQKNQARTLFRQLCYRRAAVRGIELTPAKRKKLNTMIFGE